jgi:hypothetical protein
VAICFAIALPVANAEPWNGRQAWGLTVSLNAGGIRDKGADEDFPLGGLAVEGRFRFHRRWELQFGADTRYGEEEEFEREVHTVGAGMRFHMNPQHQWVASVDAGLAVGGEHVTDQKVEDPRRVGMVVVHSHLGASVERRFRHLGLGAGLRLNSFRRDKDRLAEVDRDLVTKRAGGGELRLSVTYYF